VEAFLNMPPSALFPVPAEVSAQTFLNASRNFLWRLGFATISKSDARMLLNSARLWAKVNNAKFAAVPVVEPVWSAEMEEAEMAVLDAEVAAEEAKEAAALAAAAAAATTKPLDFSSKKLYFLCPVCSKIFPGGLKEHMHKQHGYSMEAAETAEAAAKTFTNSSAVVKAMVAMKNEAETGKKF
jgi:hypothetical protein